MIVDDDEIVIALHKIIVEKSGLSPAPESFTGGKEALNYLEEQHQEGHSYLILLDINMPNMSGWDFLDIIQTKSISGHISVIMVTSSIDIKDKEMAEQYKHVIDFVEKPLNFDVCKRIKQLLQIAHLFKY